MDEIIVTVDQLEAYIRTHRQSITLKILLDGRPVRIIRIMPFEYLSKNDTLPEILYTIQYIYYDEIDTATMNQLTVTDDGYGFSRHGRLYQFSIVI
jgi:hypothetical protein